MQQGGVDARTRGCGSSNQGVWQQSKRVWIQRDPKSTGKRFCEISKPNCTVTCQTQIVLYKVDPPSYFKLAYLKVRFMTLGEKLLNSFCRSWWEIHVQQKNRFKKKNAIQGHFTIMKTPNSSFRSKQYPYNQFCTYYQINPNEISRSVDLLRAQSFSAYFQSTKQPVKRPKFFSVVRPCSSLP